MDSLLLSFCNLICLPSVSCPYSYPTCSADSDHAINLLSTSVHLGRGKGKLKGGGELILFFEWKRKIKVEEKIRHIKEKKCLIARSNSWVVGKYINREPLSYIRRNPN